MINKSNLPSPKNSKYQALVWSTFPYEESGRGVSAIFHDLVPLSFSISHHELDLLPQTEKGGSNYKKFYDINTILQGLATKKRREEKKKT
jgi:hypothetical protein